MVNLPDEKLNKLPPCDKLLSFSEEQWKDKGKMFVSIYSKYTIFCYFLHTFICDKKTCHLFCKEILYRIPIE